MQTLSLAELLDKQGNQPSHNDAGLSTESALAINTSMLQVMELCKWAMGLGDLDIGKLIAATDGR